METRITAGYTQKIKKILKSSKSRSDKGHGISIFKPMGRMNKMVVKKMTDDSPEYRESNLWIVNGTAEDLCREIYESRKLAMLLSGGKYNIKQPLNKNFVKKILVPD